MKLIVSLVFAVGVVLLTVNFVSEGVLSDGAAVVTRVEGTVIVVSSDAPAGRPLKDKDRVTKNDQVEVQGNSRLEIRLPDNGFLRLSENTRLTMRTLQFEKKSGSMNLQAFLHTGKAWVTLDKRASPDASVEVITGTGLTAGRAGVYNVDAKEGKSSAVSVYEGVVLFDGAEKKALRTTGQTGASGQDRQVRLQAMQQISVTAPENALQPRDLDLKTAINDWVRWNLQRDAREGLASLTITPAISTITRGTSLQFAAVAHYPDDTTRDVTLFATWKSSAEYIAKIDPFGLAAGTELGDATIAAAIEDISGSAALNVSRDLVSIKVTPASRSIMNGEVQQFSATGTFSDRSTKDITSSAVWKSSNAAIAFVDAAGRIVAGNTAGTAVISASLGAKRGNATLKVRRELVSIAIVPESAVTFPGGLSSFRAVGAYSDKTTQDLSELVTWNSSDTNIALMEQVQPGRVLGQNAGSASITATLKKISGAGTITVRQKIP